MGWALAEHWLSIGWGMQGACMEMALAEFELAEFEVQQHGSMCSPEKQIHQ